MVWGDEYKSWEIVRDLRRPSYSSGMYDHVRGGPMWSGEVKCSVVPSCTARGKFVAVQCGPVRSVAVIIARDEAVVKPMG